MADGWTIEPETVLEKNRAALAETKEKGKPQLEATLIQDLAGLKQPNLVTTTK